MWRFLGVLGHGGHGTVYLVERTDGEGLTRRMALKVLGAAAGGGAERLRDEARLLALVRHRAVARAEALVRVEGRWAMLLEYVEGASLREALLRGPLPPAAACEVVGEVARALDAVWSAPGLDGRPLHVVHRDLKPSNVQLTAAGEVKLLDFGIARAAAAWREAVTTEGVAGTPGYVPPERLDGEGDGPAGDVFALGVLFAEALSGQPVRQFPVAEARFQAHLERVLERVGEAAPLLRRLLARDPAERPSARVVEREVEELRRRSAGPGLRDWAEATIPRLLRAPDPEDPLVGRELAFGPATPELTPLPPRPVGGAGGAHPHAEPAPTTGGGETEGRGNPSTSGGGPAAGEPRGGDTGGVAAAPDARRDGATPTPSAPAAAPTAPAPTPPPPRHTTLLLVGLPLALGAAALLGYTLGPRQGATAPNGAVAPPSDPAGTVGPGATPGAVAAAPEPAVSTAAAPPASDARAASLPSPPSRNDPVAAPGPAVTGTTGGKAPLTASAGSSPAASASDPSAAGDTPPASGASAAEAPPAVPTTGSVRLSGDAQRVLLVGTDRVGRPAPGNVPAGTYTVRVWFEGLGEGPGGTLNVPAGGTVLLDCQSGSLECRAR